MSLTNSLYIINAEIVDADPREKRPYLCKINGKFYTDIDMRMLASFHSEIADHLEKLNKDLK